MAHVATPRLDTRPEPSLHEDALEAEAARVFDGRASKAGAATPISPSARRATIQALNWQTDGGPLLMAVARAIETNDGRPVSPEMVNATLEHPLAEGRLHRELGELRRDGYIEGPGVEECAAPTSISLAPRGRQEASGWPSGDARLSISGSTIGNLAMRDINISNVDVANFFDAWERKIDELDAPSEAKEEARDRLHRAKEIATGAASSAGGRVLYDAFSLLFG
jgi:hypothetical protein